LFLGVTFKGSRTLDPKIDLSSCLSTVSSLLSSSPRLLSYANKINIEVTSSSSHSTSGISSSSSSVSSSSSSSSSVSSSSLNSKYDLHKDKSPTVFVTCRHSSKAGIPVDNLGGEEERMIKQDISSISTSSLSSSSSSELVSGIGFFNLDGITILHDRVHTRADIEQLLVHELVHAVDHHVTKLDLSTCGGLACSEIRAAKLAECYASWNLGGVKKRCTRNFAKTSTRMVFGPIHGPVCVDAVFDECYRIE